MLRFNQACDISSLSDSGSTIYRYHIWTWAKLIYCELLIGIHEILSTWEKLVISEVDNSRISSFLFFKKNKGRIHKSTPNLWYPVPTYYNCIICIIILNESRYLLYIIIQIMCLLIIQWHRDILWLVLDYILWRRGTRSIVITYLTIRNWSTTTTIRYYLNIDHQTLE